ncbi:hypothetical protein [Yinghuangia soli]|uniref:Uncharacterized protein n=1 Tax=Yinghuangia soli TaxID=2908204 RepID=A0AA41PUZ5_9ACTN|nr:hypothetical protein [Yinghuangia soli]MCF2526196.1 hypothetical protein [Yinghuangia soli]
MPDPIGATDEQLRRTAKEFTDRWIEDTERALADKWENRSVLTTVFGDLPEKRRPMWRDVAVRTVRESTIAFRRAAEKRRAEVAEQAFVLLRDADPRLTAAAVATPSPETRKMLQALAPSTVAGGELAAILAAGDAAGAELAARAPVLDDLWAAKGGELALLRDSLGAVVKHVTDIETAFGATWDRRPALLALGDELATRDAVRPILAIVERTRDDADRAVRMLPPNATLREQHQALAVPFDRARATVRPAIERMAAASASTDTTVAAYELRFVGKDALHAGMLDDFVDVYGAAAVEAFLKVTPRVAHRVYQLVLGYEMSQNMAQEVAIGTWRLAEAFPAGTTAPVLAWVFEQIAAVQNPQILPSQLRYMAQNAPVIPSAAAPSP